jgi:hypothetical protein
LRHTPSKQPSKVSPKFPGIRRSGKPAGFVSIDSSVDGRRLHPRGTKEIPSVQTAQDLSRFSPDAYSIARFSLSKRIKNRNNKVEGVKRQAHLICDSAGF